MQGEVCYILFAYTSMVVTSPLQMLAALQPLLLQHICCKNSTKQQEPTYEIVQQICTRYQEQFEAVMLRQWRMIAV